MNIQALFLSSYLSGAFFVLFLPFIILFVNNFIMLNAYYDIDTGTNFTPYIGAGLGLSHQKVTAGNAKKSSNELAWQVGGGVSYAATENVFVDFGYKYVDNGSSFTVSHDEDNDVSGKTDFESESNEFYLGVRYAF